MNSKTLIPDGRYLVTPDGCDGFVIVIRGGRRVRTTERSLLDTFRAARDPRGRDFDREEDEVELTGDDAAAFVAAFLTEYTPDSVTVGRLPDDAPAPASVSLLDYINTHEHVMLHVVTTAGGFGETAALGFDGDDLASQLGLHDLTGTITSADEWEWDGTGSPSDSRGNSLRAIRAYVDEPAWRKELGERNDG